MPEDTPVPTPTPAPASAPNATPAPAPKPAADPAARIAELEAQIAALKGPAPKPTEDLDLVARARKATEDQDRDRNRAGALQDAIRFDLTAGDFFKLNAPLLPPDAASLWDQAQKENFADAIEKANAIKAGLVQSFFKVQANHDLLTASQKAELDAYLKLTKTGKEEKAQQVYNTIFEPTFEGLKRMKKAEALRSGFGGQTSTEAAHTQKMVELSKRKFLKGSK